jgi:hypothetical protein
MGFILLFLALYLLHFYFRIFNVIKQVVEKPRERAYWTFVCLCFPFVGYFTLWLTFRHAQRQSKPDNTG